MTQDMKSCFPRMGIFRTDFKVFYLYFELCIALCCILGLQEMYVKLCYVLTYNILAENYQAFSVIFFFCVCVCLQWISVNQQIFIPHWQIVVHALSINSILFKFSENKTNYLHYTSQVNETWFKDV